MTKIRLIGGSFLKGEIPIEVNKNAVLPTLCATLLTSDDCVMRMVPKSPDVIKILAAIEDLGGEYRWDNDVLYVNCKKLQDKPVSNCVADIQSAILFVGPLLARFGYADVPMAIGCKLGYRGPEDHIEYLSPLGVLCTLDFENKRIKFFIEKSIISEERIVQYSNQTIQKHFIFDESSVTPTENLLMFLSSVTKFDVKVEGIAQEPHVKFLVKILVQMGMTINGEGSILFIKGVLGKMKGFKCDFSEEPDFVDFYGNAVMVAISKGRVLLKCITTPAILHMVNFLRKTGVFCEITPSGVFIDGSKTTLKFSNGFSRANETTYKHNPRPWPGFPVDCLPSFIALVSTHGFTSKDITINNWMYEDGLKYVEQLQELGATIETYPTEFGMQKITASSSKRKLASHGEVMIEGVPVIEGVRALISYANQEIGTVIINDIAPILRRSPNFIVNLQSLGVNINIIP